MICGRFCIFSRIFVLSHLIRTSLWMGLKFLSLIISKKSSPSSNHPRILEIQMKHSIWFYSLAPIFRTMRISCEVRQRSVSVSWSRQRQPTWRFSTLVHFSFLHSSLSHLIHHSHVFTLVHFLMHERSITCRVYICDAVRSLLNLFPAFTLFIHS